MRNIIKIRSICLRAVVTFAFSFSIKSAHPAPPQQQPERHEVTASHSWADRVNLDDLVPYNPTPAAWSDRNSDVAIAWTRPEEPSIQQLESVVGWWGTQITDTLLSWEVTDSGRTLPLRLKHRNYRPDKIIESDEADDLAIIATAAFPVTDAIAVRFSLVNRSQRARTITVDFNYPGKRVPPVWKGPFPTGSISNKDNEEKGLSIVSVDNEPQN